MAMPEESRSKNIQYVTDAEGRRIGVILPVEEFEGIMDELEEMEDARAAEEARREIESGEDEFIPFDQAVREIEEGKVPLD